MFTHYFIYRYLNFKLKFFNNQKKYNLTDRFTYHNLYIVRGYVVVSRGCLMINYISLSLAVIVCLVMWWSFLAVSGLEESWAYGLTTNYSCQQIEASTHWIEAATYEFILIFIDALNMYRSSAKNNQFSAASSRWHSVAAYRSRWLW